MLFSRAILRTSGDSGPAGSFGALPVHRGWAPGLSDGAALEPVQLAGRLPRAVAEAGLRVPGEARLRRVPGAPFPPSLIRATTALTCTVWPSWTNNSPSVPAAGDGNLSVHFIGRNLEQRFIAFDLVAGLLQPFGQGSFDDAFAHLGHYDVCHCILHSPGQRRLSLHLKIKNLVRSAGSAQLFTSSAFACTPSAAIEVTGFARPQGTMYWKY